jgi:L-iditol 2-dehydrogenase
MTGLFKTAPGRGNLEIREAEVPVRSDGEALIQVKAAGICGSDLHIYNWDTQVPMNPPVIIGHEFSGVVAEVGPQTFGLKEGDRVTAEPTYHSCGTCLHCQTGFYNLCADRKVLGFWVDGAFAQYVKVPARRVHQLPEHTSFLEGALLEPLACCVHGVLELSEIAAGEKVVVSGPGAIGLLALQLAKAAGAAVMLAGTGVDEHRLSIGRDLGADRIVDASRGGLQEAVLEFTDGRGADVVLECSGSPAAAAAGLEIVRKRGRYTQIGLFGRPIEMDFEKIAYREIRVTGSFAQKWTAWRRAIEMVGDGRVKLKPLITQVFPLRDWREAFDRLNRKQGLKLLLDPQAGPV